MTKLSHQNTTYIKHQFVAHGISLFDNLVARHLENSDMPDLATWYKDTFEVKPVKKLHSFVAGDCVGFLYTTNQKGLRTTRQKDYFEALADQIAFDNMDRVMWLELLRKELKPMLNAAETDPMIRVMFNGRMESLMKHLCPEYISRGHK